MQYVYHSVPQQQQGTTLYPLTILKEKYPGTYEQEVHKYEGRRQVQHQQIPLLNCFWNDVLHLTAVHPYIIKQALIEAGRGPGFTLTYYQIDPWMLPKEQTVVYLYEIGADATKNYIPYNPQEIEKFSTIPEATKNYYSKMIATGNRPLLYHRIPHILYKGTIDTTTVPIIHV